VNGINTHKKRGPYRRKSLFHAFSVQKRIEIRDKPGKLLILKYAIEKGPPLCCFVPPQPIFEYDLEALEERGDSSIRCAELLTQEVWSLALLYEKYLHRRDTLTIATYS